MKCTSKKVIATLFVVSLLLTGCSSKGANMSSYPTMSEKNQYVIIDYTEASEAMKNKKDGIYVVAHPATYSSLNIVPIFDSVLKDQKQKATYIDMSDEEKFTGDINRRIVEFIQRESKEDVLVNFRPLVVSIKEGNVRFFTPESSEIDVNSSELSADEQTQLKADLSKSIFEYNE